MIDFWYRWCLISNFKNLKSAFNSWWFFLLDWPLKVIFRNDDWCVCPLFTIGLSGFDVCELSHQRKVFEHLQLLQYWFDFNFDWFYRLRILFFVWFQIFMLSNCQVLVAKGMLRGSIPKSPKSSVNLEKITDRYTIDESLINDWWTIDERLISDWWTINLSSFDRSAIVIVLLRLFIKNFKMIWSLNRFRDEFQTMNNDKSLVF